MPVWSGAASPVPTATRITSPSRSALQRQSSPRRPSFALPGKQPRRPRLLARKARRREMAVVQRGNREIHGQNPDTGDIVNSSRRCWKLTAPAITAELTPPYAICRFIARRGLGRRSLDQ
jgi:hypothetical protein